MDWCYKNEKKRTLKYFWRTLASNALFWNAVQFSLQVKRINFVWMLTHIFKDYHNDSDSYCKDLTEKVMVSFKVELNDVACFYSKVQDFFSKTGWWKTFFSQVKGHFMVKLKTLSGVLAYTFRLLWRKHWVLVFIFIYQFKVFPEQSDAFGTFYDKKFKLLSRGYWWRKQRY